jgi:23S rRNA pseudouridine955/2504/2580 synthase
MINFTVENEVVDQTLISFLKKRFKTTPLSLIYKLFRSKKIQVDGKSVRYYHHRLKAGERITIHDSSLQVSNPNFSSVPKKSQLNLSAVYEDQNLLIVRKEHGVSMPELDKIVQYYFYQQNSG